MLGEYDNKMMPASANKGTTPVIHPVFAKRFAAGWKIVPSDCPCGGKWAWMKPRANGKGFVLHGCICHETPERS
jgi:hypothetical protein